MYRGMERGVDIIEDDISTRGAIEQLVMHQRSGQLNIQTAESGGAAQHIDTQVMQRLTGGEIPSQKISRLEAELNELTQEL